jgi:peptidoglycan/LPS O-acetylase OafA/YrhL
MTITDFFKIRLIRLHPMVIVSVIIGAICFWFDPYSNQNNEISLLALTGITLISITLLPSPDVHGWGETHSLNGPCWSLLQEYIANVLYALFGKRMLNSALWILVIISGVALTWVAVWRGDLGTGWSYETFWIAITRMMFPFFAGLLLFRTGKLIRVRHAYVVCSLMLMALFFFPNFQLFNGWFEAICIIMFFPIIVAAGAGGQINGKWAKLCNFSGAISYPIYIIHYPFMYIYIFWIYNDKPDPKDIVMVASAMFVFFVILAFILLKFYDEPVRNWLKNKLQKPTIAKA